MVELDAGCCGMAGSFGFESEHYELSMRIGGMRLFPAVRQEPEETLIAATGVSCRQQIHHGTGRAARHPVQIVRDALGLGESRMSFHVTSILVLVAIFVIGTPAPDQHGPARHHCRVHRGHRRSRSTRTTIFAGFPGDLFIILVGITYLFAIANNNGTVDWLVHAAVKAVGGRVGADPVGDVRDHRRADRGRLGRPGGGGDHRADRARLRGASSRSTRS